MTRSRKRIPSHGVACGDDAPWNREQNRILRRVNRQRVYLGLEPLIRGEGGIYDLYKSPEDGRTVYFNPSPDQLKWARK